MATDKQIQDAIDNLKELQGGLGQLADMMDATQQVSDSLLTSFRDFATQGSSNTLWNAVSRFSSGIFPGFWSLQNKIRAVAVYMQYVEKKQKEQIKKESEIARTINKQAKVRMQAANTLDVLNKKNISALEYQNLLEDDYFKSLVAKLGKEEAILEYRKKFNAQLRESLHTEVELAKEVRERIESQKAYQSMYEVAGLTNKKNLTQILYFTKQASEMENDRLDLEVELQRLTKKRYVDNAKNRKLGRVGQLYDRKKKLSPEEQQRKEELEKLIAKLQLEEASARQSSEFIQRRSGVKLDSSAASGIRIEEGEEELEKEESGETVADLLKKKFLQRIEKIRKVISAISLTVALIWKKGPIKLLGNFLKKGLAVFGAVLLWIAIFGLIVFTIIKTGAFEKIASLWEWFTTTDLFANIIEGITTIFEGVGMIFGGIWEIFGGLFSGDGQKIWEGLGSIVDGVWKLAMGAIKLVVGLVIGLFGGSLETLLDKYNDFKSWLNDLTGGYGDLILHWVKYIAVAAGAALIWMAAGGGTTGAIAMAGIAVAGGLANMPPKKSMASGGRIGQGGNILVGEAGPEIVSLPANSFVTPAVQSRGKMGNNISVQVNGRVGASDAELNEIARKIGQKINRQMNQYGSSGYRA